MTMFKRILTATVLGISAASAAPIEAAQAQGSATYLAILWVKPDGGESLAEYEKHFRAILGKWRAHAHPLAVLSPRSFNTQDPHPFKYRLPDRIDIVTFPNAATWPQIAQSSEWRAIKPLRDAALEDLVIFETKNLLDGTK